MKHLLLTCLISGLVLAQLNVPTLAQDATEEAADDTRIEAEVELPTGEDPDEFLIHDRPGDKQLMQKPEKERGVLTRKANLLWAPISLPLRITTSLAAVPFGLVHGTLHGAYNKEKEYIKKTFGKADENLLWIPVGLVAMPVAIPIGAAEGAPHGAHRYGSKGYYIWDEL